MGKYRLDVLEVPDERLRHRREFEAPNDAEAKKEADTRWREYVAFYEHAEGMALDRYVLYQSGAPDRVVYEHVERKR